MTDTRTFAEIWDAPYLMPNLGADEYERRQMDDWLVFCRQTENNSRRYAPDPEWDWRQRTG